MIYGHQLSEIIDRHHRSLEHYYISFKANENSWNYYINMISDTTLIVKRLIMIESLMKSGKDYDTAKKYIEEFLNDVGRDRQ